jgi:prevent-host-death family protein
MNRISQREMRNDSASILRRVAEGESFVVTNGGQDAAMLLPITMSSREQMIATGELAPATEPFDPSGWDLVETDGDSAEVLQELRGTR